MPDFTPEQLAKIRFCLERWDRIDYFNRKGLFDWSNGWIKVNYKPTKEIQGVEHFQMDSESERSYPQLVKKTGCAILVAKI